jgi:hypothetical protein
MKRGVVLFAHNSETVDYLEMAKITAARINRLLDLPVTLISDEATIAGQMLNFDKVFTVKPDASNRRKKTNWINKGRYAAFDLSPYDHTIVLDTDYVINSTKLNRLFGIDSDFVCHDKTFWLTCPNKPERLNSLAELGIDTLWATVMCFRKTQHVQQIFQMMAQVQNNYEHYANIYGFLPYTYRNDYALTIALKTCTGHLMSSEYFIPWSLTHVNHDIQVLRDSDTQYTLLFDTHGQSRKNYLQVKDMDFHMLGKDNFLGMFK